MKFTNLWLEQANRAIERAGALILEGDHDAAKERLQYAWSRTRYMEKVTGLKAKSKQLQDRINELWEHITGEPYWKEEWVEIEKSRKRKVDGMEGELEFREIMDELREMLAYLKQKKVFMQRVNEIDDRTLSIRQFAINESSPLNTDERLLIIKRLDEVEALLSHWYGDTPKGVSGLSDEAEFRNIMEQLREHILILKGSPTNEELVRAAMFQMRVIRYMQESGKKAFTHLEQGYIVQRMEELDRLIGEHEQSFSGFDSTEIYLPAVVLLAVALILPLVLPEP